MKRIDITDKLNFEESPVLVIKDQELALNDDAITMLKIMSVFEDSEQPTIKEIIEVFDLIFTQESKDKLAALGLKAKDFSTIVEEAMNLITGEVEDEQPGELQLPGTVS
jgi:hypothetical protein